VQIPHSVRARANHGWQYRNLVTAPQGVSSLAPSTGRMDAVYNHITMAMHQRTSMPGRATPMEPERQAPAGRVPGPPGEAATCPARCDHKARRPDATTTRLALRLTILPPDLPPNGTGRRMGGRSRVRAKEPVREAMAEIFPPD
jgi:hypothetical protein